MLLDSTTLSLLSSFSMAVVYPPKVGIMCSSVYDALPISIPANGVYDLLMNMKVPLDLSVKCKVNLPSISQQEELTEGQLD